MSVALGKTRMTAECTGLLTDLYQLNMLAAYLDHGLTQTAVFELFVRKLPARRGTRRCSARRRPRRTGSGARRR